MLISREVVDTKPIEEIERNRGVKAYEVMCRSHRSDEGAYKRE